MTTWVHTNSTSRRQRAASRAWAAYLLAGGLIFLGLFLTRAAEQTRDSLVYALAAKTGEELFHSHHLIYTPAIRLFYLVIQPFCPGCDAVFAGQIHNMIWAAVGILAFFHLVKNLWGFRAAIITTLLFTGLRGYWELSTQTTMYVPGAAILTLLSAVLISRDPKTRAYPVGWAVLIAGLLALAILYHQANILFVLPLGVYLFAAGGKFGLRAWLYVVILAGLVTLFSYLLVYLLTTTGSWSVSGFIRFCLAYTSEICLGGLCKASPDNWGSFGNLSAAGLNQLLSSLFWNVLVLPDQVAFLALPMFGLSLLALTGWQAVQVLRRASAWALRLFSLTWFYIYTIFFFWWLPSYQHPFVIVMIPLSLLGVLAVRDIAALIPERKWVERLAAAAAILAALVIGGRNFQTSIFPLHQSLGDSYQEAAVLDAAAPRDCVFLTSYRTWNNLRYYFDRQAAVQAKHPLSFFYLNEPLPSQYQFAEQPCLYVATTFLMPTYVSEDYSDDPINAYQTPDRWLAYLTWLFDIQPDGQTQRITSRDFEVLDIEDGDPYLRLLPVRRTFRGLDDFFQQLDAALDASSKPFMTWFAGVQ